MNRGGGLLETTGRPASQQRGKHWPNPAQQELGPSIAPTYTLFPVLLLKIMMAIDVSFQR